MVSSAAIQQRINHGSQIAANVLGNPVSWYRSANGINPISPSNLQGTLTVRFDTSPSFNAAHPAAFGKPCWYALFDRSNTLVGDILTGADGTYYIAQQQSLLPTLVVRCNATLSFYAPGDVSPGSAYYGGESNVDGTPLMTSVPASVLEKSRGERGDTNLPGDVKLGNFEILCPALGVANLRTSTLAIDQSTGYRYTLSSAELTDLGWRLLCSSTDA